MYKGFWALDRLVSIGRSGMLQAESPGQVAEAFQGSPQPTSPDNRDLQPIEALLRVQT